MKSNACAQSLAALCLIIILMLLQICRIICVISVHSDVLRPCYSVEEGGGGILGFVSVCLLVLLCLCWPSKPHCCKGEQSPKLFCEWSEMTGFSHRKGVTCWKSMQHGREKPYSDIPLRFHLNCHGRIPSTLSSLINLTIRLKQNKCFRGVPIFFQFYHIFCAEEMWSQHYIIQLLTKT